MLTGCSAAVFNPALPEALREGVTVTHVCPRRGKYAHRRGSPPACSQAVLSRLAEQFNFWVNSPFFLLFQYFQSRHTRGGLAGVLAFLCAGGNFAGISWVPALFAGAVFHADCAADAELFRGAEFFALTKALQRAMSFPFPLCFMTSVSSESLDRCVMMFLITSVWVARIQDGCHSIGKVLQFFSKHYKNIVRTL